MLPRERQSVVERHDPQLFVVRSDDPDFTGADFPIDPGERTGKGGMT
jgi:hypothetical protein